VLEVDVVDLASEFPNDNPALHRGVIWVCTEPTGGPRPERSPVVPVASAAAWDAMAAAPASDAGATVAPPELRTEPRSFGIDDGATLPLVASVTVGPSALEASIASGGAGDASGST